MGAGIAGIGSGGAQAALRRVCRPLGLRVGLGEMHKEFIAGEQDALWRPRQHEVNQNPVVEAIVTTISA